MKRGYAFLALILGVVGGILRGLQLHTGYEPGTGLPIAGNLYWYALVVLSVAAALFFFFLSGAFSSHHGVSFASALSCSCPVYRTVSVVCAVGLMALGLYGAWDVLANQLPLAINMLTHLGILASLLVWLLSVVAGVSILFFCSLQSGKTPRMVGVTVAPMFWSGLLLIFLYRSNASDPVLSDYMLELLTAIAIMYSFYALAGFLFSATPSPRKLIFCTGISTYLLLTTHLGRLSALLLGTSLSWSGATLLRQAMIALGGIFLFCNLLIITRRLHSPMVPTQPPEQAQ